MVTFWSLLATLRRTWSTKYTILIHNHNPAVASIKLPEVADYFIAMEEILQLLLSHNHRQRERESSHAWSREGIANNKKLIMIFIDVTFTPSTTTIPTNGYQVFLMVRRRRSSSWLMNNNPQAYIKWKGYHFHGPFSVETIYYRNKEHLSPTGKSSSSAVTPNS